VEARGQIRVSKWKNPEKRAMKSRKIESGKQEGGIVWSNRFAVAVGDPAESAGRFLSVWTSP